MIRLILPEQSDNPTAPLTHHCLKGANSEVLRKLHTHTLLKTAMEIGVHPGTMSHLISDEPLLATSIRAVHGYIWTLFVVLIHLSTLEDSTTTILALYKPVRARILEMVFKA